MELIEERGTGAVEVGAISELQAEVVSVTKGLSWLGERTGGSRGLHVAISHLCQKGSFSSLSLSAGLGEYKRSIRSLR